MEDAEKLTALKRAYADIILNTAKEAAARVMASERKAHRFHQELCLAKDESLRLLLRLKQMMDIKVKEAELTSLTQQKKIDELEAQLQEAEDIVNDLRQDLREVQDELERMRNQNLQDWDEQNTESMPASLEEQLQANRLSSSGNTFPLARQYQPASASHTTISTSNHRYDGNKCNAANDYHVDFHCDGKPDFASIIMRNKEPELYRNGCTQRIRAFEGNLLGGNLSFHGQQDDEKNERMMREDEENRQTCSAGNKEDGEDKQTCSAAYREYEENWKTCSAANREDEETRQTCIAPTAMTENKYLLQAGFKRILRRNNSHCRSKAVKAIHRKRNRAARYKKLKVQPSKFLPKKVVEAHQISDNTCSKTVLPVNVGLSEKPSIISNGDAEKHLFSPLPQIGRVKVNNTSGMETLKPCFFRSETSNNKALVDKEETKSAESLKTPNDLLRVDVPLADSDSKALDTADVVPSQPRNDMFLKYTFSRKRKKSSLGIPGENASLGESTPKKEAVEKQHGSLEPQNSTLMESSRGSRRLAQVARQLISLSEKRR